MSMRTTPEFIAMAIAAHGVRYDYSRAVYLGCSKKITVGCILHGDFFPIAVQHTSAKVGCPSCAGTKRHTTASFVERARFVHGRDKYDYSQINYVRATDKVIIRCQEHGDFEQIAVNHLMGRGCRQCSAAKVGCFNNSKAACSFVAKARNIHGARFDYKRLGYVSSKAHVSIGCLKHGQVSLRAAAHLQGHGCPKCGRERISTGKGEMWATISEGRLASLYFLRVFDEIESFFKVGVTFQTIDKRFRKGKRLAGYNYEVLAIYTSPSAASVWGWEQSILSSFPSFRYKPLRGFDGASECFSSCEEILSIFPL